MSQANGNIFGDDFFPTPRQVARKMVAKISKEAKYWLEPSAGKGDICEVILNPYTHEEFEEENPEVVEKANRRGCRTNWSYERDDHARRNIDTIETHPGLVAVLRSKDFPVVGYEWLDYNGTSYYDAIAMNPPFSNGAAHLLKAWDFLHNGEIVCLLNQETIDNPYTEERKRLKRVIDAAGGTVEALGPCFDTAERKTNVSVAMVYLKKVAVDDSADLWAKEAGQEKVYNVEVGDDPNMLAIRDNLGNMEHWYNMANEHWAKGIEHIRKARLYMNQNKISDYRSGGNRDSDFKQIAGMAIDNANTSRTEFLRRHRLLAWTSVFTQMEFDKWLDSKQQEKFMRDVERDATIPFTAENIKGTLENSIADQVAESEYFEIRFFKKGTVHLKWKRLDLLESFNKHAAAGKKWIGENTQQYRPKRRREDRDCNHSGGHVFENGACKYCEDPEIDPVSLVVCELCREIFAATGDEYCPLHPKTAPAIEEEHEPAPMKQLAAPDEPDDYKPGQQDLFDQLADIARGVAA